MKSARYARRKVSSRSTRPPQPTSFRAHNHQLKRATGVRPLLSNVGRRARVLSFVPGAEGRLSLRRMAAGNPTSCGVTTSLPAPLRRHRAAFCGYRTSLSAALSLPSRATGAPPVR